MSYLWVGDILLVALIAICWVLAQANAAFRAWLEVWTRDRDAKREQALEIHRANVAFLVNLSPEQVREAREELAKIWEVRP